MAQRSSPAAPRQVLVLVLCFLARTAAGVELSVNNRTANFTLSTEPGPSVSLSCLVQDSSQAEELLWYRGEGKVDLKDGNKVNVSHICISPVSESDNGVTFTCRLTRNNTVQVSVVLDVRFPPSLGEDEAVQIEEGKDVTLTCNTKSNPQGQTEWYKDNAAMTLQQDRHRLYRTSEVFQLSIQNAEKSDNGTYTCEVTGDPSWGVIRKDFLLIVEDKKPVFPTEAVIAAAVVVTITVLFGILARRESIVKVW
ncbi:TMIG1 protein, partial [Alectura lathami]|nr:TMIG1 protein [Alectura lathami]